MINAIETLSPTINPSFVTPSSAVTSFNVSSSTSVSSTYVSADYGLTTGGATMLALLALLQSNNEDSELTAAQKLVLFSALLRYLETMQLTFRVEESFNANNMFKFSASPLGYTSNALLSAGVFPTGIMFSGSA